MKKKLSKVLAVVLSLVMVAGLATIDASTAQAAKKKATKLSLVSTGKKNVKSGQKRTIKIKGTNAKKAKWSVSGTGKSYIKLAKKSGKTVSFTVKANATGKAKITAKLTKKNKVSVTYKLSCDATAIALEGKDVYIGEVNNLVLTATPSNAKLTADVAYGVFSDEAAETASTDAVVTAGAMGCEFYTAKAGTYYVKATAGEMTSIAKVTAAERVAKLESVQQTKANELAVTFDFDASKVVPADVEIKNGNGVVITANKVTVDKDDNKKATITTFSNMTDGKVNTISYKGGTALEFQASNGEVASIEITPETAPIKTAVEVKALVLDANKVELDSFVYGKENTEKYVFDIVCETGSADSSTGKLTMEEIGKTATATVTFDTGKVDASNNPITVVGKKTITAVAEGNVTGIDKVKFMRLSTAPDAGKTYDDIVKENSGAAKDKVRVLNSNNAGESFYLYAVIKDENGYEKVNGSLTEAGYILKSSDDKTLIVDGDEIKGANKGKASILVCDDAGNVKFPIPVEVEEASKLTKLDIKSSDTIMKLTTGNVGDPGSIATDSGKFNFTALDQYGDNYGNVDVTATADKDNHGYITVNDGSLGVEVSVSVVATGSSATIPTSGAADAVEGKDYIKAGSTVRTPYTVEVTDKEDGSIKLSKKVYVDLSRPSESETKLGLVVDRATVNTALEDKKANGDQFAKIRLAVYDNRGTLTRYDYMPTPTAMEFLKAGKAIGDANVTTGASIADANVTAGAFAPQYTAVGQVKYIKFAASKAVDTPISGSEAGSASAGATISVVKRADNARYTVRVKNLGIAGNVVKYNGSTNYTVNITVENSQKDIDIQLNTRNGLSGDEASVAAKAFRISASDTQSYTYDANKTDNVKYFFAIPKNGYVGKNEKYVFNKLTVYVPYRKSDSATAAADMVYNEVTKNVNGVVTPE